MVGNFPQWEKKSLPLHGSFSTAAPVLYAGIYLPLFSQCRIAKEAHFVADSKITITLMSRSAPKIFPKKWIPWNFSKSQKYCSALRLRNFLKPANNYASYDTLRGHFQRNFVNSYNGEVLYFLEYKRINQVETVQY